VIADRILAALLVSTVLLVAPIGALDYASRGISGTCILSGCANDELSDSSIPSPRQTPAGRAGVRAVVGGQR